MLNLFRWRLMCFVAIFAACFADFLKNASKGSISYLPWSFGGGDDMKTEDLLMDNWLQWQMDNLSLLSSWMNFDRKFLTVSEKEVHELSQRLKGEVEPV